MIEFGRRNPLEAAKPAQPEKPKELDFAKEKPKYERISDKHPEIEQLLEEWKALDKNQKPETARYDAIDKARIEQQLEATFQRLTN